MRRWRAEERKTIKHEYKVATRTYRGRVRVAIGLFADLLMWSANARAFCSAYKDSYLHALLEVWQHVTERRVANATQQKKQSKCVP